MNHDTLSPAPRTFINTLPDWSMLLAAITTIFLAAEKQWMILDFFLNNICLRFFFMSYCLIPPAFGSRKLPLIMLRVLDFLVMALVQR